MKPNKFPNYHAEKSNDELREKILRLSMEEFLKRGYSGVKLEYIARELRISKKTIYTIFPSKRELFIESSLSIFLGITDIVISIINDASTSPSEKILNILNSLLQQISKIPPSLLNDLRIFTPKVYQDFLSFRELMLERYKDIFTLAQQSGYIRKDVRTDFLIDLMLLAANNMMIPEYFISKNILPVEGLHQLLKIIFLGILNEDARKQIRGI